MVKHPNKTKLNTDPLNILLIKYKASLSNKNALTHWLDEAYLLKERKKHFNNKLITL